MVSNSEACSLAILHFLSVRNCKKDNKKRSKNENRGKLHLSVDELMVLLVECRVEERMVQKSVACVKGEFEEEVGESESDESLEEGRKTV